MCFVNTDAQSYLHRPVEAVLPSAEKEKKIKYSKAVEARRACFIPFVVSVNGILGSLASYIKEIC